MEAQRLFAIQIAQRFAFDVSLNKPNAISPSASKSNRVAMDGWFREDAARGLCRHAFF